MNCYRIGIDEAGRGSVYGPLSVAGVVRITRWTDDRVGDSKKITPIKRQQLEHLIKANTLWSVAMVEAKHIEQYGMKQALGAAGNRVVEDLVAKLLQHNPNAKIRVTFDGNDRQDCTREICGVPVSIEAVIKADDTVFECGAASILAKETRDRWVITQVNKNPDLAKYDLASNKGYGTPKHRESIITHGLTDDHRTTFCNSLVDNWRAKQQAAEEKSQRKYAKAKQEDSHRCQAKRSGSRQFPAQRPTG